MNVLFDVAIKGSLVLALALATTALLRKRSAALRHCVLASAIVCAATMPALRLLAPAWDVPFYAWISPEADTQVNYQLTLTSASTPAVLPGSSDRAAAADAARARVLTAIWIGGAMLSLSFLIAGLLRLAWLASRSVPLRQRKWADAVQDVVRTAGLRRRVQLLQSANPSLVMTWGTIRPKVILPAEARTWTKDRMRIVLAHEIAHVQRGDWAVQVTAELARCIYWFNPLFWIACRRLRQESEFACDDAVMRGGIDGADYASHVLEVARDVRRFRHPLPAALSIAHPSTLERRIRAMLDAQRPRVPLTRRIGLLATVTVLAAVVPIAGFGPPSPLRGVGEASPLPSHPAPSHPPTPVRGYGEASLAPSRLMPSVPAVAETQRGTASVSGVIQDQLGGLLPGVAVTIADARSGTAFTVRSNRDGVYEFTDIPEATYTLVATLPGFRTENMGLEMRPGSRLERPIVMQIGSVQETITITGSRSTGSVPNRTPQVVPPSSPSGGRGAVPPAPAPRVSGIGGNLRAPVKIKDVKPVYPAAPQTAGVSGIVIVAGKIDVDGFVKDLNVERQLDPELANALLDAVSQWQFVPTQLNGVPVDTAITITGNFTLD
jgi:TonB family protein